MKINRYTAIAYRLIPLALALLVMGAAPPVKAETYIKGFMGSGLYDFLIQTNCYAVSAQSDTRTPDWISDGTYPNNRVPLLAAGTSTGIVRTVDLADQVTFFSSNPAVMPPPPKIQAVGAIGGVGYQPTKVYFTINAPSRPTNIDITAQSSVNSVVGTVAQLGQPKRVTRKFRVYPPQRISKTTLGPAKPAPYSEGERLRIDVTLRWKIPFSTTTVVIGQPVYKNKTGHTRSAKLPEWETGGGFHEPKRISVPPNTNKVSFDFVARFPSDAAVERMGPLSVRTLFAVPVQLTTEDFLPCPGLVTSPKSAEIKYAMQRRNAYMNTSPASSHMPSSPIQQAPLPRPSGSTGGGVVAPRDPLPAKPDAEPDDYPKPRPRPRPRPRP